MTAVSKKSNDLMTLVIIQRFVNAALNLMGMLGVFVFTVLPIVMAVREPTALTIGVTVMLFIAGMLAVFGAASLVVGVGLMRRRRWARWAEGFLSVLNLGCIPVGTIVGGLVLVYLFGEDGEAQFAE